MSRLTAVWAGVVLQLAAVMTTRDVSAAGGRVSIAGVPHVRQKPDFCGEACVAMYLKTLGHDIDQDDVFNLSRTDPLLARGAHTAELARAMTALGFKPGPVWHRVARNATQDIRAQWEQLCRDLLKGIPSIVCMRTGKHRGASEHFRLVVGYDPQKDEVLYHEPAEHAGAYRHMKLASFLECWPLKYDAQTWTLIRLGMAYSEIRKPPAATGFTDADFAQHMMTLRKKLPDRDFSVLIQKPFVVIGDESPARVRLRAEQTVKWATRRLKRMYFARDPEHIIDIWLFKDKRSYRKHTKAIFGDEPHTPFGYSSDAHRALIMNIATGGGTLVHEIVHPFMAANFPQCPAWLNEGMGSLYEQSAGKGAQVVGLTNWRLAGLQSAIRRDTVPTFRTLTATTQAEFYHRDPGTNYAQARYLCYYLQQKGLLVKFYHAFQAAHAEDPTGYETLKQVLRTKDMKAFQAKWETYTLSLSFP